jgi:hypothetical protein
MYFVLPLWLAYGLTIGRLTARASTPSVPLLRTILNGRSSVIASAARARTSGCSSSLSAPAQRPSRNERQTPHSRPPSAVIVRHKHQRPPLVGRRWKLARPPLPKWFGRAFLCRPAPSRSRWNAQAHKQRRSVRRFKGFWKDGPRAGMERTDGECTCNARVRARGGAGGNAC